MMLRRDPPGPSIEVTLALSVARSANGAAPTETVNVAVLEVPWKIEPRDFVSSTMVKYGLSLESITMTLPAACSPMFFTTTETSTISPGSAPPSPSPQLFRLSLVMAIDVGFGYPAPKSWHWFSSSTSETGTAKQP